jgi:hypothetical protein
MRYRFISLAGRRLLTAAASSAVVLTAALSPTFSNGSNQAKRVTAARGNYTSKRESTRAEPRDFISDISLTNNDFQSAGLCRESCFAATYAFSTVPFFTLDEPRSVTRRVTAKPLS